MASNKVVFINDYSKLAKKDPNYRGEKLPVHGEIYTVRKVVQDGELVGFLLEEIVNTPGWYKDQKGDPVYDEPNFNALHFRPVNYDYGEAIVEILQEELAQKTKISNLN